MSQRHLHTFFLHSVFFALGLCACSGSGGGEESPEQTRLRELQNCTEDCGWDRERSDGAIPGSTCSYDGGVIPPEGICSHNMSFEQKTRFSHFIKTCNGSVYCPEVVGDPDVFDGVCVDLPDAPPTCIEHDEFEDGCRWRGECPGFGEVCSGNAEACTEGLKCGTFPLYSEAGTIQSPLCTRGCEPDGEPCPSGFTCLPYLFSSDNGWYDPDSFPTKHVCLPDTYKFVGEDMAYRCDFEHPEYNTCNKSAYCPAPGAICESHDTCVDLQVNQFHCGSCNNQCRNGICVDGRCVYSWDELQELPDEQELPEE